METIPPLESAGGWQNPYRKRRRVKRHDRFGEVIRYLTAEELQQFFSSIDNYTHKLMFEVIYELGCRVGEFVKIQVRHVSFSRSTIFFPAQNTKTKTARTSSLPQGLTNEIKSMLRQERIIGKRQDRILKPDAYLFHHGRRWNTSYSENRIRQIFQHYIHKAGLQQVYGKDTRGRNLKMFTVHSLRHSHIMTYVVDRGLPLPIVQKQVGHRSLKTTSVYLSASTEKMAQAYSEARKSVDVPPPPATYGSESRTLTFP
jgi:integrase/recombinase XerD